MLLAGRGAFPVSPVDRAAGRGSGVTVLGRVPITPSRSRAGSLDAGRVGDRDQALAPFTPASFVLGAVPAAGCCSGLGGRAVGESLCG